MVYQDVIVEVEKVVKTEVPVQVEVVRIVDREVLVEVVKEVMWRASCRGFVCCSVCTFIHANFTCLFIWTRTRVDVRDVPSRCQCMQVPVDRIVEVPVEKVVEVPVPYEVVKEVPVEKIVTKQVQDDDTINRLQVFKALKKKHRGSRRGGIVQRNERR